MKNLKDKLNRLEKLDIDMFRRDFLLTTDKTDDEIEATILVAEILQTLYQNNVSARVFESGLSIAQFRDNSTRTRFSFSSASNLLGLAVQELDEGKSQISHGETVRETSNMISFLSEAIGIRDDMYIGMGQTYMREVAAALDDGFAEGVLDQRPAVVNLQCDIDHPTQSMSDLAHLKQWAGGDLANLKGKKIAMTWAYSPSYGKPLSVPQGIITLMTRMGMDVSLAYPEGYDLLPDTVEYAKQAAIKSGGNFTVGHDMGAAFENADIVYPKSWAPFKVMEERTRLVKGGEQDKLHGLEQECLTNNAKFMDWECTADLMKRTKNGEALYMHCLPADITDVSCKHGEVSADVFEKYRIATYKEARYKPFIIAAMILTSRFRDPGSLLDSLARKGQRRLGLFKI
jgi:knotted carbamoyltransferase YgeW